MLRRVSLTLITLVLVHVCYSQSEAVSSQIKLNIAKSTSRGEDKIPPIIEIYNSELQKDRVNTIDFEKLTIKGFVYDSCGIEKVFINGNEIKIDEDGIFQFPVDLIEGRNLIIIHATDKNKNTAISRYYLYRSSTLEIADLENHFGTNHSLIIGVENYLDPRINDLDNPIEDAEQFKNTLVSAYTFDNKNIIFLKNPTKSEIIKELTDLRISLSSNDNLIIFYAGHGVWDEGMQTGYWLPQDAKFDNRIDWFSNTELRNYIRAIRSSHILLISDACFGGSILKLRDVSENPPPSIDALYKLPSRKALTSGMLSTVPDRSVFMEFLITRLKDNQKKFLTAEELFSSIRMAVINNSPNYQVPQYGAIHEAGDQGGDFIFIKK
jgi:hypothetical protein